LKFQEGSFKFEDSRTLQTSNFKLAWACFMKIASFNVNSVRMRMPVLVEWMGRVRPDVVALQETKVQDHEFPKEAFEAIGYRCAFRGQKSYNGVAILSPHAIENVEFGLLDEPRDEARLIKAEVQGVTIINTYVPQGVSADSEQFRYKLDWFHRLRACLRAKFDSSQPVLWAGDLNIAPEPIDVYDPVALLGHVCFHPQVHAALREVMAWGFTDLFRLHHPESGQYTFWDYRSPYTLKRNLGWRLDHLMGTVPLQGRCRSCMIDKEPRMTAIPSDHTPIIAEFD
jgi:exodeoxyribonuclease III